MKMPKHMLEYFKACGRKGGKIGGKIAAEKMTAEQRRERALKAVRTRERRRAEKQASS
jgi:hypothetical protein